MAGPYQTAMRKSIFEGDQFKRARFKQHVRSMTGMGQGSRNAEYSLAREKNKNMSKAETGMWHTYVTKGGKKPSMTGEFGGGPPNMGEAPVLEMPEYDEDKVSSLTQKRAAPAIRRLRETTQRATSADFDNPNVKRMTVREALQGYGTGLEGVVAGAGRAATAEYGDQYAASVNASMAKFQAEVNMRSQRYDTWSKGWLMERQHELEQEYGDPYEEFGYRDQERNYFDHGSRQHPCGGGCRRSERGHHFIYRDH